MSTKSYPTILRSTASTANRHSWINRLEMVDGASADDKKVLAALAVATNSMAALSLTGSDAFKQKS
ncbi:hypothetical protein NYV52_01535 [Escherichia coli]|nr:hypothetical protein [Escherichia coli]